MKHTFIKSFAIFSLFVFGATHAFALSEAETKTRVLAIIGELTKILGQLEEGTYCTGYNGETDIMSIQKALAKAGYNPGKIDGKAGAQTNTAIQAFQLAEGLKVDGKVGPMTRAALAKKSPRCSELDLLVDSKAFFNPAPEKTTEPKPTITEPKTTTTAPVTTSVAPVEQKPTPTTQTTSNTTPQTTNPATETSLTTTLDNGEITATLRSSNTQLPNDTGVFTFKVAMNSDKTLYVPVNPADAFVARVVNVSGARVSTQGVPSIVSTGTLVTGIDGKSYFALGKGASLSIRITVQPGAGSYYAQLERLNYTFDDVTKITKLNMINHGFDTRKWTSETIKVLN